MDEVWKRIPRFTSYSVSNYGHVRKESNGRLMSTSITNYGHVKVSLWSDFGTRHTRSVALLVAQAFCKHPDHLSNSVMVLDGNLENTVAWNLVWRPKWFAWKYARQLRTKPRRYYETLPVINITQDIVYDSIVQCGMVEGLLFDDIWRSTYRAEFIYPHFCLYQILK